EWTGVEAKTRKENIEHIHDELTGRVIPWDLVEDFHIYEGASPTKDAPGWQKPKRIVIPAGLSRGRLAELKGIAPDVEFVPARDATEAANVAGEADAVLGFATSQVVKAAKSVRWSQSSTGGVAEGVPDELTTLSGVLA